MKNKKYNQLYKLLKTGKSHAGFTLIELLSGLIMSTIVIGGLGFGLFQLTRATRDESNKITARNETSRAMDFISDEVRRAQNIELIDLDNNGEITNLDVVAPNYDPPNEGEANEGTPRLALQIPDVEERIIYSVSEPLANSPWEGPLVLYRWGPNLNAAGEYNDPNNPGGWQNEPLIDGLDDEAQNVTCGGNAILYQGFFACVTDDDNDDIVEDGLTDNNNDGVVNLDDDDDVPNDSIDDVDGLSVTAQLYFSSGIDIANTNVDKKYAAETQVVARARVRDTNEEERGEGAPISFRTLGAEYSLHTKTNAVSADPTFIDLNGNGVFDADDEKTSWTMRTDFMNGNNHRKWKHDPDRQGQQIYINTDKKLQIASIPIGNGNIVGPAPLSSGNPDDTMESDIYTNPGNDIDPWTYPDTVKLSEFTIDFNDPTTYNGTDSDNPDPGVDHVRIFKKGSELIYQTDEHGVIDLDGYDDNPDTDDGEYSLGEFLADKGYAKWDGSNYRLVNDSDDLSTNPAYHPVDNPDASPKLFKLKDTERLIAVEIGQVAVGPKFPGTDTDNPGFDLQDSVFILSVDKFAGDEESH